MCRDTMIGKNRFVCRMCDTQADTPTYNSLEHKDWCPRNDSD